MHTMTNKQKAAVLRVWRDNPEMTVAEAVFHVLNGGMNATH